MFTNILPLGIFHGVTTNPTLLERVIHRRRFSLLAKLDRIELASPSFRRK
jgi:transaldolase